MNDDYRKPRIGQRYRDPDGDIWIIREQKGEAWELGRDVPADDVRAARFLILLGSDLDTLPWVAPPCADCGEPECGSLPEGRCRDCDIQHVMSASACRECHVWIINPHALDIDKMDEEVPPEEYAKQHKPDCSLRLAEEWWARTPEEYAAVREARYGWAPEARP